MWDEEVDVAVIGAGIGGLATALATVEAGGEVLVVDPYSEVRGHAPAGVLRERVGALRRSLLPDTADFETNEYLAAVTDGVLKPVEPAVGAAVPRREARNLTSDEAYGRFVEPFFGSRLNAWASQCISSPYGLLYTSMRNWPTTSMRSAGGESIEVFSVGSMPWADDLGEVALRGWLTAQAKDREVEIRTNCPLERIVFEEGLIVGVVVSTPDGPRAVRTRAGITFAPADQADDDVDGDLAPAAADRLQVCIVGRTASRYARVELLDTEPANPSRPTCTGSRKQLRDGLHDTHRPSLDGWRCGKMYGYPPLGE